MKTLNEIEKKIDTNRFIYNGENIWPIFRNTIGWKIALETNLSNGTSLSSQTLNRFLHIKLFIKNIFYFLFSLFKAYDLICFTTSDDYRDLDGCKVNRLTELLINRYKDRKILEFQSGFFINKSDVQRQYISNSVFVILSSIVSKAIVLNNIYEIEQELEKLDIKINSKKILKNYLANKIMYNFVLKVYRPKLVITTCYTFMSVVKSANDLNIETLEFQHGNIINHFAYDIQEKNNSTFYPKNLAIFGKKTLEFLVDKYYAKDIFIVGNLFVDYYSRKINESILKLKKDYSLIISISLQWTVLKETVEYVERQAKKNKDICFILIPRINNELNNYSFELSNIKIFYQYNCYEIIANSDYHMTCYSTCAIEAPSLGVENIFLNINGLSEKYLGNFIVNKNFNKLINLNDDIKFVLFKDKMPKEEIIIQNEDNILNNYNKNIESLYKYLENNK